MSVHRAFIVFVALVACCGLGCPPDEGEGVATGTAKLVTGSGSASGAAATAVASAAPTARTGTITLSGGPAATEAPVPTTAVPAAGDPLAGVTAPPKPADIESKDILVREPVSPSGSVKHVLVAWSDLASVYGPRFDPRAAARSKDEADALAWKILHATKGGAPIDPIMRFYSEDPGSAATGKAYDYHAAARLVPPFKNLSMRLELNEAGIVQTKFGWHVILRVK